MWTDEQLQYQLTHTNSNLNFRNKQWFRDMTQERKDSICERLCITEDVLKRAGTVNEFGKVVIDVLRLSYTNPIKWKSYLEVIRTDKFRSLYNQLNDKDSTVGLNVDTLLYMLSEIEGDEEPQYDTKIREPKSAIRLQDIIRYINNAMKQIDDELESEDVKECAANKIHSHLLIGLQDLGMLKQIKSK